MSDLVKSDIEYRTYIDDNEYFLHFHTLSFKALEVYWTFEFFTKNLTISKSKKQVSSYELGRSDFGIDHFREKERKLAESFMRVPEEVFRKIYNDNDTDFREEKKISFPEELFLEDFSDFVKRYPSSAFTSRDFTVSFLEDGFGNPKQFVEKWKSHPMYSFLFGRYRVMSRGSEFDFGKIEMGQRFVYHSKRHIQKRISDLEWQELLANYRFYRDLMVVLKLKEPLFRKMRENFDRTVYHNLLKVYPEYTYELIFVLHQIRPLDFPYVDSDCLISFKLIESGELVDKIPEDEVFDFYLDNYLPWYQRCLNSYDLRTLSFNSSLKSYGMLLRTLSRCPGNLKILTNE